MGTWPPNLVPSGLPSWDPVATDPKALATGPHHGGEADAIEKHLLVLANADKSQLFQIGNHLTWAPLVPDWLLILGENYCALYCCDGSMTFAEWLQCFRATLKSGHYLAVGNGSYCACILWYESLTVAEWLFFPSPAERAYPDASQIGRACHAGHWPGQYHPLFSRSFWGRATRDLHRVRDVHR